MLVSLAASLLVWHFHLFSISGQPRPREPVITSPAVVYGAGLATSGSQQMTCSALVRDAAGAESCTAWTVLEPGQRVVSPTPLPAGVDCAAAEVDQRSGRWICTSAPVPG